MNLGVIMGGMSTEHYVSIVSGTSIVNNLNKKKYKIFPIYIDLKGNWYKYIKPIEEIEILQVGEIPQELEKINNEIEYLKNMDVVFPALHGLYGEDGTIQGLLELLNVKYVGCKVLASAVSMDKVYTKILFEKANIPQANYIYIKAFNNIYTVVDNQLNEQELNLDEVSSMVEKQLGYPAYVKPSNSGSSVGISKAKSSDELKTAIKEAVKYDKKILIEEEIKGKEIECAILKNEKVEASTVGEILSADEFYSFDAKYKNKDSKTVIPANISKMEIEEIRKLAIKAFNAAPKPSAVFHDMDSSCPPTRCVAIASAPYPETIRVNTMEIAQYAIPWIAVGIPILQIPPTYSRGSFANSFIPFSTFSFFCTIIPNIIMLITIACAVTVAIAAPATPSLGKIPGPRIRTGSNIIFIASPTRLARNGVFESPCAV